MHPRRSSSVKASPGLAQRSRSGKKIAKQDLSDPSSMFAKLFSTDFSKAGTMGLLRQRNIFDMNDPALLDTFLKNCPEAKLDNETDKQFQRRWNNCFDQNRLFAELKDRSEKHNPPFQDLGTSVRVGTPSEDGEKPVAKHANVCTNSVFQGGDLILLDPGSRRQVRVNASGFYPCPNPRYFPDIQLNDADAYSLFHRRTQKFEQAIVFRQ